MIGQDISHSARYSQIRDIDIANGDGCRVSIWLTGCPFRCPGCFNEAEQDPAYGSIVDVDALTHVYRSLSQSYIRGLTILGGEPLAPWNYPTTLSLAKAVRYIFEGEKDVWLFTGYRMENVQSLFPDILNYTDVLVDGRFEADKLDASGAFRGSTNQRIWRKAEGLWKSDRL